MDTIRRNSSQPLNRQELDAAAQVLRALSHPIRLGVLQCLKSCESMTVSELQEALGCSQSMMSQQLRTLEHQGLIASRKVGTTKHCSLRNRDFLRLLDCVGNHLRQVLADSPGPRSRVFSE